MKNELIEIAKHYRRKNLSDRRPLNEKINQLYSHYIKKREEGLIDAMASVVAVGSIFMTDQIDYSEINPQMEEAFNLAFPNQDIESLTEYSTEQLQGIISAWKGKYFEVIVRDKMNNGEWVGDVHLEQGQQAILADTPVQEGWDLQILNADGTIAQELQLKATNSLSYVKEALEKYPDIDVLTTEEISNTLSENILSSNISNDDLSDSITEPLESLLDTPLGDVAEAVLPGLPFILIAVGEGRHIMTGRKSFELAASSLIERSVKTGISIGAGSLAFMLTDMGLISIPVTILTKIGIDRYENFVDLIKIIKKDKTEIQKLLPYYGAS